MKPWLWGMGIGTILASIILVYLSPNRLEQQVRWNASHSTVKSDRVPYLKQPPPVTQEDHHGRTEEQDHPQAVHASIEAR